MRDPQTFAELRAVVNALPKNVLVPSAHIHSLLDETEKLVEHIADLERQLAAMSPMIEACKARYETHSFYGHNKLDLCQCLTCQWYRDYEARKPK